MSIRPIDDQEFRAQASGGGPDLHVTLVGNADLTVKAELYRFMTAVHEEARRTGAKEVVVDLKELEFINSSCLKSLVWWISSVNELTADRQYRITFLTSPAMYWQRRSLSALAGLASDLVSISA